jgi:spore germination protein PE
MFRRISNVESIKVNTMLFSSILQIGDSTEVNAKDMTIAVQREQEIYFGREGSFQAFPMFSRPVFLPPIYEPILPMKRNLNHQINVGDIYILGASASAIIHIGSSDRVYGENRRKLIRQLSGVSLNRPVE